MGIMRCPIFVAIPMRVATGGEIEINKSLVVQKEEQLLHLHDSLIRWEPWDQLYNIPTNMKKDRSKVV
jgi:hypothetical protein